MKMKLAKLILISMLLTVCFNVTAYAGTWKEDYVGWWYQNDDGSYPTNGWYWLSDSNNPSIQKCYYFDANGYMHEGPTTPDGYTVNDFGEWIQNGVVQTRDSVINTTQTSAQVTGTENSAPMQIGEYQVSLTKELDSLTGLYKGVMKTEGLSDFNYYLYVPKNATENMPLVVYLHSGGTMKLKQKNKEERIVREAGIEYLMNAGKDTIPAYVLMPYVDYEDDRYEMSHKKVSRLIEAIVREYTIDRNRISAVGLSSGGSGAIILAHNNPDLLSCIVAISPPYPESQYLKSEYIYTVSKVPLWYIFEEIGWNHKQILTQVNKLRDAGGTVWVDVLEGKEHNNMNIFQDGQNDQFGIFNWAVSMSK